MRGVVKDYGDTPEGEVYAQLVANLNYWEKGYPKIRNISFVKFTPEEALRALTDGRLDLMTSVFPKDTIKVAESPKCKLVKDRECLMFMAGWLNLMSPQTLPLRDIRVRKALNYAVNKEELKRYAFKGNAVGMRGALSEKSGVDLSEAEPYHWNVAKARELLEEAGYGEGFRMKVFYEEADFLVAQFLKRFYSLLKIDVEITAVESDWKARHVVYPNIREGYSWEDEDWSLLLFSSPQGWPEQGYAFLEWFFHSGASFQAVSDYLIEPLNAMYKKVLRTKDRDKRFDIYKKANDYIADQAFWVFTMVPLAMYGVNKEVEFVPQVARYYFLEYSSVTDSHWSIRGK